MLAGMRASSPSGTSPENHRDSSWSARGAAGLTGVLCLALVGCVQYHPKPIDAAKEAQSLESRTLADPGLRAYAEDCAGATLTQWPPQRWDFPLLTEVALYFSADLAQARAGVKGAEADLYAAGLHQDPNLSASLEHRLNSLGGSPSSTWGPTLDIPLTTAGKRGIRQAGAVARLRRSQYQLDRSAWMVRSSLRSSLVALQGAQAQSEAWERLARARETVLDLMAARLQVGEASAPEAEVARAESQNARLSLAAARRAESIARAQVAKALGVPTRALEGAIFAPLGAELPEAPQRPEARKDALTGRSDLMAALAAYAASDEALRLEVRSQYPDLRLQPGYLWDQGSDAWVIGLSLALPLLNRNRGAIAQAEAAREVAGQSVLAVQASILHELEEAEAAYGGSLQTLREAQSQEASRLRSLEAAKTSLAAGEEDAVVLALSQAGYEASRIETEAARIEAQQTLRRLEDALERPISPDVPLPSPPGMGKGNPP